MRFHDYLEMYFFTYLALIINLHLSMLEAATCDKTQLSLQKSTSSASSSSSSTAPAATSTSTPFPITPSTTSPVTSPETSIISDTHIKSRNGTVRFENDLLTNFQTNNNSNINEQTEYTDLLTSDHSHNNDKQQYNLENLNLLRVEYNKYKILSNLGLNIDPDELEPNLDNDLRYKLTTSKIISESQIERNTNMRHKRSLACDQVKSDKDACCLEKFYVNFTDIGWDKWILYPAGYNANYCRGQCDLSHARYYHSTLLSKFSNVIGLCCSPKQMAPLRLLYIDESNKVHQKSIPDMVVQACDCA